MAVSHYRNVPVLGFSLQASPASAGAQGGFLSGGFTSAGVAPGDSIVVPEKRIPMRLMKKVKDIKQTLYQIAVTAGVLIVVF